MYGIRTCQEDEKRYASGRKEEEVAATTCPCGEAIKSRAHRVEECEMYKEERDVFEDEKGSMDEYGMEKSVTLDNSEKTVAIPGDRWWPYDAK